MKKSRAARTPRAESIDQTAPASIVVNKFGGLARFCDAAEKAGNPYATSTVWGWIKRGDIPLRQVSPIKAIGMAQDPVIEIPDSDFFRTAG